MILFYAVHNYDVVLKMFQVFLATKDVVVSSIDHTLMFHTGLGHPVHTVYMYSLSSTCFMVLFLYSSNQQFQLFQIKFFFTFLQMIYFLAVPFNLSLYVFGNWIKDYYLSRMWSFNMSGWSDIACFVVLDMLSDGRY